MTRVDIVDDLESLLYCRVMRACLALEEQVRYEEMNYKTPPEIKFALWSALEKFCYQNEACELLLIVINLFELVPYSARSMTAARVALYNEDVSLVVRLALSDRLARSGEADFVIQWLADVENRIDASPFPRKRMLAVYRVSGLRVVRSLLLDLSVISFDARDKYL